VEVAGLVVLAVEEHPAMVWLAGQAVAHLTPQNSVVLEF
jgi:hypothetical protein